MKLKEIFIRGFKSFLGPIRLDLSFRIVAIVGPNGCGKSNVIDAVRWCLGEQNSRTLRGLKMEDVIFNGAGEIKPLGMAEVKLLLEECNDQTVPEHLRRAEIEITRRLYRTGESEYLINNTPCRLKDIQELFMGTGLGQRSYSIIGQGAIGAIVDYRPEQLRDLLHEAVDITRYQKQMELAQRRISEAKENLLRVRDLIVEVEKGVNLLKRQAERAKKYKKLTEEIQNLELTLLCNEFALLNKGLQEVNSYCSSLYTHEASIRKEITNQEGLLQEFELQIEEGDVSLKKLRKTYGDLKHNYESKKSTLENKRNELSFLQNRNYELTNEINELLGKKEKLEYEISLKCKQVNDLQVHIDETKERRAEYEKRIQDEEQKLKRIREEYRVLNEQFINLQKQKHSIQRDLEFLYKTKNEIEKRRRELEEEKEGLQSHMKGLNENWRLKAKEKKSYEERLMGLEVEKRAVGQEIQEMVSFLAQLEGRERALEKELTETKLKIKATKEFLEGYVGMRGGTRFLLQKREALKIEEDGIKGLLLDLIDVEPGIEKAVEAVLGERLEYVVVGSMEDSVRLLRRLKEEGKGKSGFIISKNGNGKVSSNGNLLRLIKAPDELRPVLSELLGDVELVESLEDIIKTLSHKKTYVTKDGDVIFGDLIVYGGSEESTKKRLLSKKTELKDLENKYVSLELEYQMLTSEIQKKKSSKETIELKYKNLEKEWYAVQEKLKKLEYEMYKIASDIEVKQKLFDNVYKNIQRKSLENDVSSEQINELKTKLDTMEGIDGEKKSLLNQLSQLLKEREQSQEDLKKEFYRVDASLKVLFEKKANLEEGLRRLIRDSDEVQKRLNYLNSQIESNKKRIENCKMEIQDMEMDIEVLKQNVDDYRYQINKKEEIIDKCKAETTKIRANISKLSENLNRIKDDITKTKMSEAEIRTEMKNLMNLGIERYNADISKIYSDYLVEDYVRPRIEASISEKREQRAKLGEVNLLAISEYEEAKKRYDFLKTQEEDIVRSIENINNAIRRFRGLAKDGLMEGLNLINSHIQSIFCSLFGGGTARVRILEEQNLLESGMILEAELPHKRLTHLGLLSGGEKSLVAASLLFAIFKYRPSPFCLLDEVDSALDEVNVERLCNYLQELKEQTQILIVTHKPRTMAIADTLYGITMETKGISRVLSASLKDVFRDKEA